MPVNLGARDALTRVAPDPAYQQLGGSVEDTSSARVGVLGNRPRLTRAALGALPVDPVC